VASYLIDVEKAEEEQLAKADTAAGARHASPMTPPGATPPPSDREGFPQPDQAMRTQSPAASDRTENPKNMFEAIEGRWGSREVEITEVTLRDPDGTPGHVFQSGDAIEVRLKTRAHRPTSDFVFGIGFFNADGVCCYGTNTNIEELEPAEITGEGEVVFRIARLDLVEGTYKIDVAAHKLDGYPYDYHRLLHTFRVKSRTKDVGIYRPSHHWEFTPNIRFK
jgi:hypothetical protein